MEHEVNMSDNVQKVKGFFLYFDQFEAIRQLSNEQKAMLLDAMFVKFAGGEYEITDPSVRMAFNFISLSHKQRLNKYAEKSEKARESINKRWENERKKRIQNDTEDTNVYERIRSDTNDTITITRTITKDNSNTNVLLVDSETVDTEQQSLLPEIKITNASAIPDCPHEKIIEIYHECLPELRRVKTWNSKRAKAMRARWRENWNKYVLPKNNTPSFEGGLDYWRRLFCWISTQDFLMGRTKEQFSADLEWIINASNFAKIIEKKYVNKWEAA